MRFDDETTSSKFVKCLRHTNQKTVARIIENGGGVLKIEVQTRAEKLHRPMETKKLQQKLEELRNKKQPWSHRTDRLISQLKKVEIEMLNSYVDRHTLVCWVWVHSQAAVETIQRLYASNQLTDAFVETIQPLTSNVIIIDRNQFKKTIVVFPSSIKFVERINIKENTTIFGVAKLQNEIYVLCQSFSDDPNVHMILVYEDRKAFNLLKEIKLEKIKGPWDIGSSEKENCLYVSDSVCKCVWKITRETDNQQKIIKWLTLSYEPRVLSVSSDGQLLMVNYSASSLMMYGSDAELIRSIRLKPDIQFPRHAVQTSIGNFIISHTWMEEDEEEAERMTEEEEDSGISGREKTTTKWVVSELTKDGEMVVRRFIPSQEEGELNEPFNIILGSDDQVFVADRGNGKIILLDSDLRWDGALMPTEETDVETKIRYLVRLCYDEEIKQLIVGRILAGIDGFNIYTLSRDQTHFSRVSSSQSFSLTND